MVVVPLFSSLLYTAKQKKLPLNPVLKNVDFLNTDNSQGSVATRLGCGGVFAYDFVTNFIFY